MQNETKMTHARMVSPSQGFTSRVMARIEERDRAQARRRTAMGIGLLVVVALVVLVLLGLWIASWVGILLTYPGILLSSLLALVPFADGARAVGEGVWVAMFTVLQNVSTLQLLVYAVAVLALTALWARVVTNSSMTPLHTISGGSK